ncbi:VCBS repeat-containing protein [Algoriphagus sp. SE2]|uniref:VCBS repeat-containing protein n=1 Tax=Algoriphagus sp. SE2 TaxID=3141536 RepID=UPI0031CD712E
MKIKSLGFLAFTVFLFSCEKEKETKLFELIPSERSGIEFENKLSSSPEFNILEYLYFYNGGGIAAGDINNDGLIDLYFTGNQVSNKLYLNKGDFEFDDITEKAGVTGENGWSTGVTMADVNGDGLLDIYVSQVGEYKELRGKNRLYINQGDETFIDLAAEFGVDFVGFSTQAVFFDYDRDGDLDMYLLNHSVKSPEVFSKASTRTTPNEKGDKLFKNLAAEGKRGFEDVTQEAGIYSSILGFGLGVGIEDFNNDGWPDIYISNDFTENDYLYLNQKDGTFLESLENMISNTSRYSMGNDLADINGDGKPEIFTTDMLPENPEIWMKSVGEDKSEVYQIKKQFGYNDQYVRNHLQVNQSNGNFSELALFAGVSASDWSWSPLIFDMDNDGLMDIHVTNGIVKRPNDLDFIQYSQEPDPTSSMESLRETQIEMLPTVKLPNYAFQNTGDLKFCDKASAWGLDQPSYSNGSSYADLDNDGDLDLIINNLNQPAFIYKNHSEKSGNHFLSVVLKGKALNRFGIGSKVSVFCKQQLFSQYVSTSRGFQSAVPPHLVFGLGKAEVIDSVVVDWPEGESEVFFDIKIDSNLILEKGSGKGYQQFNEEQSKQIDLPVIDWKHQEKTDVDEVKREYLIPRSFASLGPAIAIGDVNSDGLEDVYLGGAKDQPGVIFLQNSNGGFEQIQNPIFQQLAKAEDVVAKFADLNQDGNLDLYVGSAGNEYEEGNLFLFDRIYFGKGNGEFQFIPNALPPIGENTSSIAIHDVDRDGDIDIFLGASVGTGDYGASPKSSLLINLGNGKFRDETNNWFGSEGYLGMINSAIWADLDSDSIEELILTGDWQTIRVFKKTNDNQLKEVQITGLEKSSGWIQSLEIADINGDGLEDIISGNLGENSKLKASTERPLWLYHADFDGNGQADPIIFHFMGNKLVPFATRDDLIKQIPGIKKLHNSYAEYSRISRPEDLFPAPALNAAKKYPVYELRSGIFFQQANGSFVFEPLPGAAQWTQIMDTFWDELTQTLHLAGNFSGFRTDIGKSNTISYQSWKYYNGIWIDGKSLSKVPKHKEVRRLAPITINEKKYLLAPTNSDSVYWIKLY